MELFKGHSKHTLLQMLVLVAISVLVTTVVLTIFATRAGQKDSTPKVNQAAKDAAIVKKAAHRILDCTSPKGDCSQKNRARLAKQITQLINAEALNAARAASAGAYCAQQGLPSYEDNLDCVLTQMGLSE
jgi:putative hemolysin